MSNKSDQACPLCNDMLYFDYAYRGVYTYCSKYDYRYIITAPNKGMPGLNYIPDFQISMWLNGNLFTDKEYGDIFDELGKIQPIEAKNEYIRQLAKLDLFV